ncbi:MAG: DDE transposase, partial [Methanobrevibacter sp.]|nr:DDE transposase [Methanobrevibacter sp.]
MCINNFKIDNKTFDEIIASNDYVRFHVAFVDYYFEIIEYESEPYETGRPSYDDKEMFKLVSYAYSQG